MASMRFSTSWAKPSRFPKAFRWIVRDGKWRRRKCPWSMAHCPLLKVAPLPRTMDHGQWTRHARPTLDQAPHPVLRDRPCRGRALLELLQDDGGGRARVLPRDGL